MPDFSAAIALLRKPVEDIYQSASSAIKLKLATMRAGSKMAELHNRLWQIQRVKTIWNTDRPLSLNSIYYPVEASISTPGGDVRKRINSIADFGRNHIVIYGTAGQGKSILMKYLVGKEIRSGQRIPLLFELRNAEDNPLEQQLAAAFGVLLGLKGAEDVFTEFAARGKISFILDGFDEIDPSRIQRLLQQIDILSFKYGDCNIVITSRPYSECKNLVSFGTASICPLRPEDFLGFFKKVTHDADLSDRLTESIRNSPHQIRSLIKTPLLATLLAISYRAAHKIPLEFSEFYEELFQVLLVRHDASKLGWRRVRSSGLTDRQIQQLFEAFSFAARRRQLSALDRDTAHDLANGGVEQLGMKVDPEAFIEDIKKITCLLIEEGKKLHFVHSSVAQFFASRFVRSLSEPNSQRFYSQLIQDYKWPLWLEEIAFLQQIDAHRSSKYFIVPDLEAAISYVEERGGIASPKWIDLYLTDLWVDKHYAKDGDGFRFVAGGEKDCDSYSVDALDKKLFKALFSEQNDGEEHWMEGFKKNPDAKRRTYLEIAVDRGGAVYDRVREIMIDHFSALEVDLERRRKEVAHNDTESDFIKL